MILYLHGFRSSPESAKAQLLARDVESRGLTDQWLCPQLPASPAQAMQLAHRLIEQACPHPTQAATQLTIIGSSLGGFYATCLAEHWQCRAVVLNPVVHAARDLATQVGSHHHYHSAEPFEFLASHVDELAAMAVPRPRDPQRYYLLACTGDEVLDWREMADWYQGSHGRIIQGGDHGISDFARWLPEVMGFALNLK